MKTPEEIKKGLECCANADCKACPYNSVGISIFECIDALVCDTNAYINQLEARVPKWISVKDSLPEIGTVVLGYAKHNPFSAYEVMLVRNLGNGFEMIRYHEYTSSITHWMPMPEPPKEDMHE